MSFFANLSLEIMMLLFSAIFTFRLTKTMTSGINLYLKSFVYNIFFEKRENNDNDREKTNDGLYIVCPR